VKVGVLALQGATARHAGSLARLGVDSTPVRTRSQLAGVDGLILPGGESTTMSMLLESAGLTEPLAERLAEGMPVFGTCAGLILLASEIRDGRDDQRSFGAISLVARRNGYGRQVESFEVDLPVPALAASGRGDEPFHAVFIRAPVVERVDAGVEVLARADDEPVLCRQGPVLVAAFHPELSDDTRIHDYFVTEVM
jgi:pyridoxal 5'-phosphate synthase pdxT subunit